MQKDNHSLLDKLHAKENELDTTKAKYTKDIEILKQESLKSNNSYNQSQVLITFTE